MTEFTTVKTSRDTLRLLRLIAALTGEKQYEVLERLLRAEEVRIMAVRP